MSETPWHIDPVTRERLDRALAERDAHRRERCRILAATDPAGRTPEQIAQSLEWNCFPPSDTHHDS